MKGGAAQLRRLRDSAVEPVDGASLGVFRIVLGLLLATAAVRFAAKGWIEACYAAPRMAFTYPGFSWIARWDPPWMNVHFAALAIAGLVFALGWFYRASAIVLFVLLTYVELLDVTFYLNHYYLLSLLLFLAILLPLDRPIVPRAALWALRAQVGIVYVHAGLAKVGHDWLVAGEPLGIWLSRHAEIPVVGPWLDRPALAIAASWTACLFDLSIPFFLAWSRSRALAYAAVVVFHTTTALFFPIGMFPWIMIGVTTVFFEPGWPRRLPWHSRLFAGPRSAKPELTLHPALALLLVIHLAFQAVWPLRGRFYPGDRLWTQEAYRFSWNVMVVERAGSIDIVARDPATGESWEIDLENYLTPLARRIVPTEPDMILQLAARIAEDFRARGHPRIQVFAEVHLSINGRPSRPYVDPTVDLARVVEESFFAPRRWILPSQ